MKGSTWYSTVLHKPSWAPPSSLFGPVWTALYCIIAISYGYVGYLYYQKQISFTVLLPFILNIACNLLFTPLLFGLRNIPLATIDIVLVLGTLIWALIVIYPYAPWVTYVNIPYLLWVLFATVLQLHIFALNR